jgi:C-terminal processing protease CtpA/Prc
MKKMLAVLCYPCIILLLTAMAWPQQMSKLDRQDAEGMLQVVAGEVRKHYYDPKLHGLDWDAKVAEAKNKIEQAPSWGKALSAIAALLVTLDDSHTFFLPPERSARFYYGVQYQMIGDRCFVTEVRPGSNAEAKGVKRGDQILALNGVSPTRDTLWTIQYIFAVLRPQPTLALSLQDPAGAQRQVEVTTKIRQKKRITDLTNANGASDIFDLYRQDETAEHLLRARSAEVGDQLMVLKLPEFDFTPVEMAEMIGKARKHQDLILDLRGNPGGSVDTLQYLVGAMFEKEVRIADRVGRKETKPEVAKPHNPFTGKLIVLVDSESASASELFARVMQIEKRGLVFGDRTSGSVMESRHYSEQAQRGSDVVSYYGVSVTDADLIMTDGKSLEHVGVTPDRLLIPTPSVLASGRDPVLSMAAEELGVKLSPEEAGKMFPYEWAPET